MRPPRSITKARTRGYSLTTRRPHLPCLAYPPQESLTICGFPYYKFEDRDRAYSLGSAFYAIYFLARCAHTHACIRVV